MNKVVIFIAGAAVGSLVTWKILETKYNQIEQEDEDVVRMEDILKEKEPEKEPVKMASNHAPESPSITEYTSLAKKYDTETEEPEKKETANEGPYVIDPEDFDENGYDVVSLIYHADGFLTDEQNNLVEDIENTVGFSCLNEFGRYEEDAVHVRNDKLQTDYEILRVLTNYSDIKKSN